MCFKIPWDYSDDDNLFAKWKQVKLLKFSKTIFMPILKRGLSHSFAPYSHPADK